MEIFRNNFGFGLWRLSLILKYKDSKDFTFPSPKATIILAILRGVASTKERVEEQEVEVLHNLGLECVKMCPRPASVKFQNVGTCFNRIRQKMWKQGKQ